MALVIISKHLPQLIYDGASHTPAVFHATIRSSHGEIPAPSYELIGSLPCQPGLSPPPQASIVARRRVPRSERAVVLHYLYEADYYSSRSSANAIQEGERHGDIDT